MHPAPQARNQQPCPHGLSLFWTSGPPLLSEAMKGAAGTRNPQRATRNSITPTFCPSFVDLNVRLN
jgi:hypothetical protein